MGSLNILVVTPVFSIAGVPLAQQRFAQALASRGHRVHLVIGHIDQHFAFQPPEGLRVSVLGCNKVRKMFVPLLKLFRHEKPDIVFSAEDHLNIVVTAAAAFARTNAKISASSRVTPFDTYSSVPFSKRWFLKQLARWVMPHAHVLSCVSKDMVFQYQRVFPGTRHVCIYNIVDDARSRARATQALHHSWFGDPDWPIVVAAGRLAPWKGFDHLIKAFAMLRQRRQVRLLILGDGPDRSALQDQIDSNNLNDCVRLEGYVENPLAFFSRAQVFALSSRVEGMPNVLIEAMMCGCTPVATDCPTGPSEVLQSGRFGYLVPLADVEAFAQALEKALDCPIPPAVLSEAVEPFNEKRVIDRHFDLLGVRG